MRDTVRGQRTPTTHVSGSVITTAYILLSYIVALIGGRCHYSVAVLPQVCVHCVSLRECKKNHAQGETKMDEYRRELEALL